MSQTIQTILLLSMLILVNMQDLPQSLQHDLTTGIWFNQSTIEQTNFPRYFICGAEMNHFQMMGAYRCALSKQKRLPYIIDCPGGEIMWKRTNGIKFKLCNYQNWQDQTLSHYYGSYEWTGLQMCPKNQYVYGMKVKISELDGLTGLMLLCRPNNGPFTPPFTPPIASQTPNSKNSGLNTLKSSSNEVVVKDGRGIWTDAYVNYKQFAYSYEIKVANHKSGKYLTGLKLQMRSIPEIKSVSMQYELPPHTDFLMKAFHSMSYENRDWVKTQKRSFNSNKQRANLTYDNWFINTQRKYHDEKLGKYMFDKSNKFIEIKVPTIKSKADLPNIDVDRVIHEKMYTIPLEDFIFNKKIVLKPFDKDDYNFEVPPCTRSELQERIYTAYIQIPYMFSITYVSDNLEYVEQLTGIYKGTVFSISQVIDKNIC